MKIVAPHALALGLALLIPLAPQACATPLEITACDPATGVSQNCDVTITDPSMFGADASVSAGAGGTAGLGGNGNPQGGAAGNTPAQGGSPGVGGTSPGGGGTAQGGTTPGIGGSAITNGGAAGNAGSSGAAGTETGGSGGTGVTPVFDAASCDFDDNTGCEAFTCEQQCPPNMGTYCVDSCNAVVTCVDGNQACITEADPLCAVRINQGADNVCTMQVDSAGSVTAVLPAPAAVARQYVNCICSVPRP